MHQGLGPGREAGLQFRRGEIKAVGLPGGDDHRLGFGQHGHGHIGDPVGGRNDDLVAWIEQHLEQVVEAVLAAAGHQDLAGLVGQAVIGLEAVGDGGFQFRGAAHRGVAGKALPDGPDGGLPDVVRGVEIRLPHPEVDYIDSLRLELIGLGIQGQGGGRGNLADTTGKLHGNSFTDKICREGRAVVHLPSPDLTATIL